MLSGQEGFCVPQAGASESCRAGPLQLGSEQPQPFHSPQKLATRQSLLLYLTTRPQEESLKLAADCTKQRISRLKQNPESRLQVAHFAAVDKENFYTLSASGVLQTGSSFCELTPLSEWQQEAAQHAALRALPLFGKQKAWKAFR